MPSEDDKDVKADKSKHSGHIDEGVFSIGGFVAGIILGICVTIYLVADAPWRFTGASIWTYVTIICTFGILGGFIGPKFFDFISHI